MRESEYRELCRECDSVLTNPNSTIETVAISWLHVVREHPHFLSRYTKIFKHKNEIEEKVSLFILCARYKLSLLRSVFKAGFNKKQSFFNKTIPNKKVDVLFLTHLVKKEHINQEDDFYFGNLPKLLSEQGKIVSVVYINHTGVECSNNFDNSNRGYFRIVLPSILDFSSERILHRRLSIESRRMEKLSNNSGSWLSNRIHKRASIECCSNSTIFSLRIMVQMEEIFAKSTPLNIITTFEGHSWERMVFAAARRKSPSTCCIGYHHSALFKLQHAIKRSIKSNFDPDYILTVGSIAERQLRSHNDYGLVKFGILGSCRKVDLYDTEALFHQTSLKKNGSTQPTCLVVPEGIFEECELLLSFSMECALRNPSIRFIWRFHPVLSYLRIIDRYAKFRTIPSNIVISSASLNDDIAQSLWVLYRGSTTVIQAAVSGLRPIYLSVDSELTIDPLHEVGKSRINATTQEDVADAFRADLAKQTGEYLNDMREVISYCEQYYESISIVRLESVLK